MTGSNFASLVRQYTGTNSTTLTDATIVLFANTVKDELSQQIQELHENYFGQRSTRDLIATSDTFTNREYSLPTNMLGKLFRVEAKLDGTDWVYMHPFDLNEYERPTDEDTVLDHFGNNQDEAFYDIYRNSIWLYTGEITSSVDEGLLLWYTQWPDDLTTADMSDSSNDLSDYGATSFGLPKNVHELLARKTSMTWKSSLPNPIPFSQLEQRYDNNLQIALDAIDHMNLDQSVQGELPDDSHLQY